MGGGCLFDSTATADLGCAGAARAARLVAAADQECIGGLDDGQIPHADQSREFSWNIDQIAFRRQRPEGRTRDIFADHTTSQLIDGLPASEIAPSEISAGNARDIPGPFQNAVVH